MLGLDILATGRNGADGLLPLDLSLPIRPQLELVLENSPFTHGILCAAMSVVDECFRNPDASRRVNVEAMREILALFQERGIKPVFFSTDMVFSGEEDLYKEDAVPAPTTVYGRQKLELEQVIRDEFPDHLIFRTSKLLAMHLHPRSALTSVIRDLRASKEVHAFTDQFITPVFVEDVARALAAALRAGLGGTYHLAIEGRLSRFELAEMIARELDFPARLVQAFSVKQAALSEPRGPNHTLSAQKIRKALDFRFSTLQEGLSAIKRGMN